MKWYEKIWRTVKDVFAVVGAIGTVVIVLLWPVRKRQREERDRAFERTVAELDEARRTLADTRAALTAERRRIDRELQQIADERASLGRAEQLRQRDFELFTELGRIAKRDREILEELARRGEARHTGP